MASVALVEIGSAGWLDNEISENDIFTYTPDASTVNATSVRWVYEWGKVRRQYVPGDSMDDG